jgi:hypothetical protein
MFGKIARVAFLFLLAVMVVSYAISASKGSPAYKKDDQPTGRMYS